MKYTCLIVNCELVWHQVIPCQIIISWNDLVFDAQGRRIQTDMCHVAMQVDGMRKSICFKHHLSIGNPPTLEMRRDLPRNVKMKKRHMDKRRLTRVVSCQIAPIN